MRIIDGKAMAKASEASLKEKVKKFNLHPKLLIVSANPDNSSQVYMRNKRKACERIGIECEFFDCSSSSPEELIQNIMRWNNDFSITGIIVQLPMPERFDVKLIQQVINPEKDVDGFGLFSRFKPCTPEAVMTMLENEGFELENKRCVVIGRSDIVGKPLAEMLRDKNANVTVCHSKTNRLYLSNYCRNADFIFCAAGVPNLIQPEDITPNQTVLIDISINRDKDGKLCGDADPSIFPLLLAYTPVPGGVGPMTVNTLMRHLCELN